MNTHEHEDKIMELLASSSNASSTADLRARFSQDSAEEAELQSMEATFRLLDEWTAPEPSPWFDQKMAALLRAEQEAAPAGFFERLRSRMLFNTGSSFRPMLAGSLALVMLIGGGSYAGFVLHGTPVQASATVQDLQILDNNEQALQQVDQLLLEDTPTDEGSAPQS